MLFSDVEIGWVIVEIWKVEERRETKREKEKRFREMKSRILSLPKRKAEFIEPMDCAPVTKLADGPGWVYEVLCGGPHKISSVAFGVMWR